MPSSVTADPSVSPALSVSGGPSHAGLVLEHQVCVTVTSETGLLPDLCPVPLLLGRFHWLVLNPVNKGQCTAVCPRCPQVIVSEIHIHQRSPSGRCLVSL